MGQPSWLSSSVGTAPDRAHGRTAVHHRGRSDDKRQVYAFLCGKARLFRSVRGTGRLWQAWLSLCIMFFDRAPARYPTSSQCRRRPACNMVPVMRGQADTCTARLAAVLDEASTAGSSAEPYWCGRLMNDLYPDRREAVRPHGGRCPARALSAHMARCSRCTPRRPGRAPPRPRSWSMTCSESAAAPARLDCKSEQFPTILSHLLMQLALLILYICVNCMGMEIY